MMLGDANIEGWSDQQPGFRAGLGGDHFRADGVSADQPVGTMLLGGADGDDDPLAAGQISLDLWPGRVMQQHVDLLRDGVTRGGKR